MNPHELADALTSAGVKMTTISVYCDDGHPCTVVDHFLIAEAPNLPPVVSRLSKGFHVLIDNRVVQDMRAGRLAPEDALGDRLRGRCRYECEECRRDGRSGVVVVAHLDNVREVALKLYGHGVPKVSLRALQGRLEPT